MIDRTKCLEPSATEGGNSVGRDPRQMGRIGLEAAGFEPCSPMEVFRAKSLDCCGGSFQEVRYCVATPCPLWHVPDEQQSIPGSIKRGSPRRPGYIPRQSPRGAFQPCKTTRLGRDDGGGGYGDSPRGVALRKG